MSDTLILAMSTKKTSKAVLKPIPIANSGVRKTTGVSYEKFRIFRVALIDSTQYPKSHSRRIDVMSALADGKKFIIPDLNFNGDFSDDTVYTYPIVKQSRKLSNESVKATIIQLKYRWSGRNVTYDLALEILPFEPTHFSAISDDELLQIYISWFNVKTSEIEVENETYEIQLVGSRSLSSTYEDAKLLIACIGKNDHQLIDTHLSKGKRYVIKNKVISFEDISPFGNYLRVVIDNYSEAEGIFEKNLLPSKIFTLIKREIGLNVNPTPFILVDFWGSWCAPCIKSIPELKLINSRYGEKIQLLGIASEFSKETGKIERLIKDHNISWPQRIEARNDTSERMSLVNELQVDVFPTFLVIDSSGRIVFRRSGTDSIEHLKDIIKKL